MRAANETDAARIIGATLSSTLNGGKAVVRIIAIHHFNLLLTNLPLYPMADKTTFAFYLPHDDLLQTILILINFYNRFMIFSRK
ncbi:hypothetical protein [Seinonella peptonophila]|uniref:hypothetical protein n=1 Tax=Seinonella peptonophila TaxID=112248 RepID=UPI00093239D4|nr:hypothetical protein [Seinonella peptonophila]